MWSEDPVETFALVHAEMGELKESGQAVGATVLTGLSDFAPPTIMSQAARLQSRQRFINLVVTNVPGPQYPLYLLGRRMVATEPMVPLAENLALGIAIMSYDGKLFFGLNGDYEAMADIAYLASDLRAAIATLAEAAGLPSEEEEAAAARLWRPHPSPPRRSSPRPTSRPWPSRCRAPVPGRAPPAGTRAARGARPRRFCGSIRPCARYRWDRRAPSRGRPATAGCCGSPSASWRSSWRCSPACSSSPWAATTPRWAAATTGPACSTRTRARTTWPWASSRRSSSTPTPRRAGPTSPTRSCATGSA